MGSNCCKNVRVAGVPDQEPNKVNDTENQDQNLSKFVPSKSKLSLTTNATISENGRDKTRKSSIDNDLPILSINSHKDNNENTVINISSINRQDQSKSTHPANDSKLIIASKLPPIHKSKTNKDKTENQLKQKKETIQEIPEVDESIKRSTIVHLPRLHQSLMNNNNDDDQFFESQSENSQSDNEIQINENWHFMPLPGTNGFNQDDRFFTSTPIPQSPDDQMAEYDDEYCSNRLVGPLMNTQCSDEESNVDDDDDDDQQVPPISLSQLLRFRDQLNAELVGQATSMDNIEMSPSRLMTIVDQIRTSHLKANRNHQHGPNDCADLDETTIYLSQESGVIDYQKDLSTRIEILHRDSFDEEFLVKRQHVIENSSYRLIIEAWRPNSIEQLVEQIRNFVKNKPTIDRLWIIFYWIVRHVEYDNVPYIGKKHVDKSAESVFRTRKAISDGYSNLFKRLCDDLGLNCEKIHGYAKMYVFDCCNKCLVPQDHCWNAVQINQYWYLIDVTWSVGRLDNNQTFKKEFNSYYFLTRSNEMIYHHFPADDKWQLLKQPITMAQYMLMPRIWPAFFQYSLHLLSPHKIIHVDLVPNQAFALVLIQSPRHINLVVNFSLNGKEVDGGHRIVFDNHKRLYRCYFAPNAVGLHTLRFLAKNIAIENSQYQNVIELEMDIKQSPSKIISFPKTWKVFFDLNLEVVSPCNTHFIKMDHGDTHTEILIRAPMDVELLGRLTFNNGQRVIGGHCLFIDRRKGIWRCLFAPHCDGIFEAIISARRRLDLSSFSTAVKFKIKAKRIPIPALSYPKTWQLFHDLDLYVENPNRSCHVIWPEYGSYAQVCIRAPDDVRLMGCIEYKGSRIDNGSLTQYNREKQYWQIFFAPERTGDHQLLVFAQCNTPDGSVSGIVVEFHLNVTQIRHSMKFPVIYGAFLSRKCRIYEPIDGIVKKETKIYLHLEIPNARQVDLTVDSKWIKNEGYRNSILRREITTGTKEVIIYAKFDENTVYNELLKYIIQ